MKFIIAFFFFTSCLPLNVFANHLQKEIGKTPNFDTLVHELMRDSATPGLAVGIVVNGKGSFNKGYGWADLEKRKKVTQDTLFNIASISKPIMGLVLMQLVDQHRLDLDEDINNYLPFKVDNPHLSSEIITLRHLATHTSGIADFYDPTSFSANEDSKQSLENHLKSILLPSGKRYSEGRYYTKNKPGEVRLYSNLGAGLAGYLVEAVTGKSLANYTQNTLFKQVGITHASWLIGDLDLSQVAVPYVVNYCSPPAESCNHKSPEYRKFIQNNFSHVPSSIDFKPYPHFGNPQYPDGGIRINIKEMNQLLAATLDNKASKGEPLLNEGLYTEMFKRQLAPSVSKGQRIFWNENSKGLIGHTGSDLGVFTAMYFDISTRNGFIILMNRGIDDDAIHVMRTIAQRIMNANYNIN